MSIGFQMQPGKIQTGFLGLHVELYSAKFWTVENIYPATSHCLTNPFSLAATAQNFLCQQVSKLLSLYGGKKAWTAYDNDDYGLGSLHPDFNGITLDCPWRKIYSALL